MKFRLFEKNLKGVREVVEEKCVGEVVNGANVRQSVDAQTQRR